MLPRVEIDGRVVADPELKFLPSGVAVANFRVAASDRKKNEQTQQWEDGAQCFLSVTCWREMAENVAESLHRGDPVVVVGRLKQREYTTNEGAQRTVYEVDADAVGPSLRWASAPVQRAQRTGPTPQQQGGDPWATPPQQQQPADPWATAPQQPQQQPQGPPQQPTQQPQQPAPQQPQQPGGWQGAPVYDQPPF